MVKYNIGKLFVGVACCMFAVGLGLQSLSVADTSGRDIEGLIKNTLALEKDVDIKIKKEKTQFRIPFLKEPKETVLVVEQALAIAYSDTATKSVSTKMFFSRDGHFLRTESIGKIIDPRRMAEDIVEQALRGSGDSIIAIADVGVDFDFATLWNKICSFLPMQDAKEFNFTAVEYKSRDEAQKTVIILNVWGIVNPLEMPDDLPEVLKNRVRVIFDLKGTPLGMDNLL